MGICQRCHILAKFSSLLSEVIGYDVLPQAIRYVLEEHWLYWLGCLVLHAEWKSSEMVSDVHINVRPKDCSSGEELHFIYLLIAFMQIG